MLRIILKESSAYEMRYLFGEQEEKLSISWILIKKRKRRNIG